MTPDVWLSAKGIRTHLTQVGGYGGLTYSEDLGGSLECSWEMLTRTRLDRRLYQATVTVCEGGMPAWVGKMQWPDPGSGSFHCVGLASVIGPQPALDAAGNVTRVPKAAVDGFAARSEDLVVMDENWVYEVGDDKDPTVAGLLQLMVDQANGWWHVRPHRDVIGRGVVSATYLQDWPLWRMLHPEGAVAPVDEEFATWVRASYINGAGAWAFADAVDVPTQERLGYPISRRIDLTDRGPMSFTTAQAAADAELERVKARTAWTTTLAPKPGQLTTMGGTVVTGRLVRPGHLVELAGVRDISGAGSLVVPVAKMTHRPGQTQRTLIEPLGPRARDMSLEVA